MKDYSQFNKFYGYEESLFTNIALDEEDKEADEQYAYFDSYMEERRKKIKEKNELEKLKEKRNQRPTIRQTFSDLRGELKKLNASDWDSIPEIKDFTTKKRKIERYTPNTDSQILSALNDNITPINNTQSGTATQIDNLSKAKNSILSVLFDKMSSNVSGQTSVNPLGYITEMTSVNPLTAIAPTEGDVQDFKKARLLLKNLISTNMQNASAWIAAARLEELDGKLDEARAIIIESTNHIQTNEDLWLEAARLHPPQKGEIILTKGISHIPKSEKLWLALVKFQKDKNTKTNYLKKALENVPSSEELWKLLIEMEEDNECNAKEILYKAVECVPKSISMWLALAKLEDYQNAKKVLNKALKMNKNSIDIWVHAAMLEEANSLNETKVNNIVGKAFEFFSSNQVIISIEDWINEAIKAEKASNIITAKVIVKNVIQRNREKKSMKELKGQFLPFTDKIKGEGCIETLKGFYMTLIEIGNYNDMELWMKYIEIFQKFSKDIKEIENVLKYAIEKTTKEGHKEVFWLLYAKQTWKGKSLKEAIDILKKAYSTLKKENIVIALVKLYNKNNCQEESKKLLIEALQEEKLKKSARLHMYLIQVNREMKLYDEAIKLCIEYIDLFPNFEKLYIIHSQLLHEKDPANISQSIQIMKNAIAKLPKSPLLYIIQSSYLSKEQSFTQARAVLEKGIGQVGTSELLWASLVSLEIKLGNENSARQSLSRSLAKIPKSGLLWSLLILMEKPINRHSKALDALTNNPSDALIMMTIGNLYSMDRDAGNARKWYENAIRENSDIGDIWFFYYKMEKENNDVIAMEKILKRFEEREPRHGLIWSRIKKKVSNWNKNIKELMESSYNKIHYENIMETYE